MSRRWRNPSVHIRRRSDPPWVATPVTAPDRPPENRRRHRPFVQASRAGRYQLTPQQATAPSRPGRHRAILATARRGQFWALLPPPAATAGPGPLAPSVRRCARRINLLVRRGEFSPPLWPQEQPPAPPVHPPEAISQNAHRAPLARRGRFVAIVPSAHDLPRRHKAPTSPRVLLVRRGRYFALVPVSVPPPGPAPLVPALHRRHRSRILPVYRGRIARFPMAGLAPVSLAWPPRVGSVTVTGVATARTSITGVATATIT